MLIEHFDADHVAGHGSELRAKHLDAVRVRRKHPFRWAFLTIAVNMNDVRVGFDNDGNALRFFGRSGFLNWLFVLFFHGKLFGGGE